MHVNLNERILRHRQQELEKYEQKVRQWERDMERWEQKINQRKQDIARWEQELAKGRINIIEFAARREEAWREDVPCEAVLHRFNQLEISEEEIELD